MKYRTFCCVNARTSYKTPSGVALKIFIKSYYIFVFSHLKWPFQSKAGNNRNFSLPTIIRVNQSAVPLRYSLTNPKSLRGQTVIFKINVLSFSILSRISAAICRLVIINLSVFDILNQFSFRFKTRIQPLILKLDYDILQGLETKGIFAIDNKITFLYFYNNG